MVVVFAFLTKPHKKWNPQKMTHPWSIHSLLRTKHPLHLSGMGNRTLESSRPPLSRCANMGRPLSESWPHVQRKTDLNDTKTGPARTFGPAFLFVLWLSNNNLYSLLSTKTDVLSVLFGWVPHKRGLVRRKSHVLNQTTIFPFWNTDKPKLKRFVCTKLNSCWGI